jgi:hypothetical protein
VERRLGRNLCQQLHGRIEEKPVIMMTLGLAFPNMMSHWSPWCVSCISNKSPLFSGCASIFYLIRLQGFDSYQIVFKFCISIPHCHSS